MADLVARRRKGAGVAAAAGKVGAVATAFLFPILLDGIGQQTLLFLLVGASLLGAVVTWAFRIETAGVSLEDVGTARHTRRHDPAAPPAATAGAVAAGETGTGEAVRR